MQQHEPLPNASEEQLHQPVVALQGGILSLYSPTVQTRQGRVQKHSSSKRVAWRHCFFGSPKPLVPPCSAGVGMTGVPCSSPSPELPLKTDVCVKKGLTPAKPPASSFLPCFFRPQNNKSVCAICSAPCGFLLSPKTCYLISSEQKKIRQRERRKEVNREALGSAGFAFRHPCSKRVARTLQEGRTWADCTVQRTRR